MLVDFCYLHVSAYVFNVVTIHVLNYNSKLNDLCMTSLFGCLFFV